MCHCQWKSTPLGDMRVYIHPNKKTLPCEMNDFLFLFFSLLHYLPCNKSNHISNADSVPLS